MSKILGIDLGTTNSAMAIVEGGEPKILESAEGSRTTPSIVALSKSNERLAGLLAKRQAVTNPQNTIFSVKRFIGRAFSDAEVQKDKKLMPFEMRQSQSGGVEVQMGDPSTGSGQGKWLRPEEVSAMVLQKMKADAEAKLGTKIEEAIITVPAYFDDSQRKATKDAGEIAGLKVRRILNEPTAAALAYGFNKKNDEQIVVYDFGGGTFDVSVLEVSNDTIEVKSTDGDTHLGGDDFDQHIIDWLVGEFKKEHGVDISKDTLALQRLKDGAEKAKHELSSTTETEINIPFVTSDAAGPKHLLVKLSRAKLEELVGEHISRSIEITKRAVQEAGFEISDIDEIILVGGQTRMPAIQNAVKELFGKEPNKTINPDEVVALGAAVQAGILQGDVKDVLLLDVTPLSLGLETLGGVMTKLVDKNTTIPVERTQVFSTAADNQTSVEIHVLQGEREMAGDNKTLGRFILDGIPPSPRGVPQIEVKFDIDANGILNVSAKDKATGKSQSVRIEDSSGLSKEEVERMKKDAQSHAEEDKKKRETIDVKNAADTLMYTAEKSLRDAGDKVEKSVRDDVHAKIEALKKIKDTGSKEEIERASKDLSQALSKVGEVLYKQQQGKDSAQSPAADTQEKKDGGEGGDTNDAKTHDVEAEDVDKSDDKKSSDDNNQ